TSNRFGWKDAVRIVAGSAGVVTSVMLLRMTWSVSALQHSFLLDHVAIVAIFMLTIESASQVLYGFERLAGFDAPPFVHDAFQSRTVAEFWMRYNTRVHRWLFENVFRASGGWHAPVRGLWLVFLV